MEELSGKVAVVTGGASGIGRALAHAFAGAGMRVAVADIEAAPLEAVRGEIEKKGARCLSVRTDVADRGSVESLAEKTVAELGKVHLLCNNAGVSVYGPLDETTENDWRWVLSVNLWGVINGLEAFLPRIKAHGEGGHIVNTASISGLVPTPGLGVYSATKHAVVGLSETLRLDLRPHGIGVTVLCPAFVRTKIAEAERNRPPGLPGKPLEGPRPDIEIIEQGIDPPVVAKKTLEAVRKNSPYVFTHAESQLWVDSRFARIRKAFAEQTR